jgi:hypothetical protein
MRDKFFSAERAEDNGVIRCHLYVIFADEDLVII